MKAPMKIYLCPSELAGIDYDEEWYDRPFGDSIEYTRTDAFVEKARKWFESYTEWCDLEGNHHCDMKSFEDFVNYMKGE